MKKRDLASLSLSVLSMPALVATMAGAVAVISPDTAMAQITCTDGSTTGAVTCTGGGDGVSYAARATGFTGSVGVMIGGEPSDTTGGFGACAAHIQGSGNWFGLTTNGGSLETVVCGVQANGAPNLPTASNLASGGC